MKEKRRQKEERDRGHQFSLTKGIQCITKVKTR
jgi:hypothetical protein